MPGKWNVGVLTQNIWSFAGNSRAPDVNKFLFWYWVVRYMENGWYVFTAPITTANWESERNDRWAVPVGGGIGKLVNLGLQPVDFSLSAYYNVEKPTHNPVWGLQLTANFLFPK